jgi:hypothetical protein
MSLHIRRVGLTWSGGETEELCACVQDVHKRIQQVLNENSPWLSGVQLHALNTVCPLQELALQRDGNEKRAGFAHVEDANAMPSRLPCQHCVPHLDLKLHSCSWLGLTACKPVQVITGYA